MPLEIGRVGQHRKASRPARLIGAGMGWRIEVCPDQTFGGAGFLDFGDQGEAAGGFGAKCGFKPARGGLGERTLVKLAKRTHGLAARHFGAGGVADFGELVGHERRSIGDGDEAGRGADCV